MGGLCPGGPCPVGGLCQGDPLYSYVQVLLECILVSQVSVCPLGTGGIMPGSRSLLWGGRVGMTGPRSLPRVGGYTPGADI